VIRWQDTGNLRTFIHCMALVNYHKDLLGDVHCLLSERNLTAVFWAWKWRQKIFCSTVSQTIAYINAWFHFCYTPFTQFMLTDNPSRWTLFLHGVCMLRECIYGECAHGQHVRRTLTLTLTHTSLLYWVSVIVVHVRILICATRQKPCRKRVYFQGFRTQYGNEALWNSK